MRFSHFFKLLEANILQDLASEHRMAAPEVVVEVSRHALLGSGHTAQDGPRARHPFRRSILSPALPTPARLRAGQAQRLGYRQYGALIQLRAAAPPQAAGSSVARNGGRTVRISARPQAAHARFFSEGWYSALGLGASRAAL